MNTRTTSASRFINEQDYAKLFAEKHAECMEQADKTDGAERTTWLNRAAYYASTASAVASSPTWATTTTADLLTEAYQESSAAIYDLVVERDQLRAALDEARRGRDGWRDAYYAERRRHDATRHALARIVNGTSAHEPHDGLSLTDCRDIARKALHGE